ncbi:MAG: hypothetical protein Q9164_000872 [Protoblastenia rupestris]
MDQFYPLNAQEYCGSPLSFTNVPDLMSSYDDLSTTDPSPSPPAVCASPRLHSHNRSLYSRNLKTFTTPNPQYNTYAHPLTYPTYIPSQQSLSRTISESQQPQQPTVITTIEFTDLTQLPNDSSQRRSPTTQQDKDAASNMRVVSRPVSHSLDPSYHRCLAYDHITTLNFPEKKNHFTVLTSHLSSQRRRAQNRASQRAFRERKEKHVQRLEHELEVLETKHHELERSYEESEGAQKLLRREVDGLRGELERIRGSMGASNVWSPGLKREEDGVSYFDGFDVGDGFFGGVERGGGA